MVFGATVTRKTKIPVSVVTYQIVGEDEADLELALSTSVAPLPALIGKEEGDSAEVQAPEDQDVRNRGGSVRLTS